MILLSFAYAKLSSIIPPPENVKKEFLKFLKKFLKISENPTTPTRSAYGGFSRPLIYASAQSALIKSEILVKSYPFLLT